MQEGKESLAEMGEARFRARLLAPMVNIIAAPLVLAATTSIMLGEKGLPGLKPWTFQMWLWIGLLFVPAIGGVSLWQTRLLTQGKPIHERALTGLSAVLGLLLNILALAVTLVVLVIVRTVLYAIQSGLPPEPIFVFLLQMLLLAVVFFFWLSPYFMLSGTVLGLLTAAVVHHTYAVDRMRFWNRPRTAVFTVAVIFLSLCAYVRLAQTPILEPEYLPGFCYGGIME